MILQDRVAVVAGAGSGIGQAVARILGREGAIVGAADRNAADAQKTLAQSAASGGRAEALVYDLTDEAALIAAFDGFTACQGQIG